MNPPTYKLVHLSPQITSTLHAQLKREARERGISLNTLVIRKLRQELPPVKQEPAA